MRTTLIMDDELLAKAREYTGIEEKTALVKAGLQSLISGGASRRPALLGGAEPDLKPIPRRRPKLK